MSMNYYGAGKFKITEEELEEIQAFLDTVNETLQIPLVLQEGNAEYPIMLAENHHGISVEEQNDLTHFIQHKYQLDKTKIAFKVLVSGSQNRIHIGLPKNLVSDLIRR